MATFHKYLIYIQLGYTGILTRSPNSVDQGYQTYGPPVDLIRTAKQF